jgi:hypothetical protein
LADITNVLEELTASIIGTSQKTTITIQQVSTEQKCLPVRYSHKTDAKFKLLKYFLPFIEFIRLQLVQGAFSGRGGIKEADGKTTQVEPRLQNFTSMTPILLHC